MMGTGSPVPHGTFCRPLEFSMSEPTSTAPDGDAKTDAPAPLRSVHTSSFPQLLAQLKSSVVLSTYQAGKLVFLRGDGKVLNTHFRAFSRPMGVAAAGGRLAVGTAREVWEFHNVPA